MPRLQDQVAIITGGALGIGGATARRLAKEGARVLIADYNLEAVQANADRINEAGGIGLARFYRDNPETQLPG